MALWRFGLILTVYAVLGGVGLRSILTLPPPVESKDPVAQEDERRYVEKFAAMEAVIWCESKGRHEGVWGDDGHRHPSYGIAQMQERTFYWLAEKAGFHGAEWKNREHQLYLLSWAIDNSYLHLWTCGRKMEKKRRAEAGP